MTALSMMVLGWALLCSLGLLGAVAMCRSGHLEDEARGWADPDLARVPYQERRVASEVTRK